MKPLKNCIINAINENPAANVKELSKICKCSDNTLRKYIKIYKIKYLNKKRGKKSQDIPYIDDCTEFGCNYTSKKITWYTMYIDGCKVVYKYITNCLKKLY